MYAIVDIAGKQYKISKSKFIYTDLISGEKETDINLDKVLLVVNDTGNVKIGTPTIKGAKISATILENNVKGEKKIVFKKKRRKGYKVRNGHRQRFSKILIKDIKI